MSGKVWFDPTSDKWALSDGEHYLEVPHWAREIIADEFERETGQLKADNAKLREEFDKMDVWHSKELTAAMAENAKLREQMERLVTLLRVDCDIDASWDGLRKFWSIGLTEDGCLMRDRACKAEAENARLREQVDAAHMSRLLTENENESLRELSARAWRLFREHGAVHESDLPEVDAVRDKMRELGVDE